MFIIKYYGLGGILSLALALLIDSFLFKVLFIWIGLSLILVTFAYSVQSPKIFRKKIDGSIPFYVKWVFVPFFVGVQLFNAWARKNDSVPPIQKIRDKLFLACRLFPSDMPELNHLEVKAVLDVTAEFDGLDVSAHGENMDYLNVPVLDHQTPSKDDLMQAISWIDNHIKTGKAVVVHCALGRGRSVLVMAAYLLSKSPELSVEEAIKEINQTRSTARLNKHQLKKLKDLHSQGVFTQKNRLAIVANPVAGGGKWQDSKEEIIQRLSPHFDLQIYQTTPEQDGKEMAQQAIKEGAKCIIACGGDGTLTEVATQLVNTDLTLGIMPMGTANALGHALYGPSSKVTPVAVACDAIIAGNVMQIDTATCNDELVLLVVGIGFEQKMIEKANRDEKNNSGQLAYLGALYDAIEVNNSANLNIQIDNNDPQSIHTGSLVIANAAPATTVLAQGGGLPDFTDGLLDVTWLTNTSSASENYLKLAQLALRTMFDSGDDETIQHTTAKRITVKSEGKLKYVVDGENREADSIQVTQNPQSLKVFSQPKN
ncbi:diacylglycerol kinase family protein [Aliiglaciecola lipolytica]|uniref:diacylglycerol kinase family protein n=1 Tax=Aliiglaciecola lipolytica TaxID=477689 RepID=UPI001C09439B|nr:diacylglycerol kinase family protein [Aliiglaciecola lipolytica]MBU2878827.1 dual specificity protein phosphatase family protein [Aliiglaciecola lipolytica]